MRSGSLPTLLPRHRDPRVGFRQVGSRRAFETGETLYQAGDPARELYLLESGRVRLSWSSAKGRSLTLSIVESGDVFGELAMLPMRRQTGRAQALTGGVVLSIPQRQVEALVRSTPEWVLPIVENLGRRLQTTERRLGDLVFKAVPNRLAGLLLDLLGPGAGLRPGPARLPDHYTHAELAEMISTYRETVPKALNRFQDDRLLKLDRKGILLLDMPRLREMALR